jgi:DNA-directed RNA polymerase subunit M/transcription elongation factor TFIIS
MDTLQILYNYLNGNLKDQLNYRENYDFPIFDSSDSTIYSNIDSNIYFDLRDILIRDKNITSQVKQNLKDLLNVYNIKLKFEFGDKKRLGIIIVSDLNTENTVSYVEMENYHCHRCQSINTISNVPQKRSTDEYEEIRVNCLTCGYSSTFTV